MFLTGLRLCEALYREAVRPLLDEGFPGLRYAAARVGPGSDVLGFDTERSTDHDWGPRLELFLGADDRARYGAGITGLLAERLPKRVRGWSTHFEPVGAPVRSMADTDGPVAHRVEVFTVAGWATGLPSGPGSPRRNRSWAAPRRPATTWAAGCWRPGWPAT